MQIAAAANGGRGRRRGGDRQGGGRRHRDGLGGSRSGLEHRRRSRSWQVAPHLEPKVVPFELQLLDVAVSQESQQLLKLVVA